MSGLFGVLSKNSRTSRLKFMTQLVKISLVFMAGLLSCARKPVTRSYSEPDKSRFILFTTYFNIIFFLLYFSSSHISFGVLIKVL
jgi:hypothetical protein